MQLWNLLHYIPNTQMEEMVLGEDYYMEDIVITGKRAEDASADTISPNYFFYYNNGKVNDYHKQYASYFH